MTAEQRLILFLLAKANDLQEREQQEQIRERRAKLVRRYTS